MSELETLESKALARERELSAELAKALDFIHRLTFAGNRGVDGLVRDMGLANSEARYALKRYAEARNP